MTEKKLATFTSFIMTINYYVILQSKSFKASCI